MIIRTLLASLFFVAPLTAVDKSTLNRVLHDTGDLLEQLYSLHTIVGDKVTKIDDAKGEVSPDEFREIAQEVEKQCPIALLDECRASGCLLSRAHQPKYRKTYEQAVSSALLSHLETHDKVIYTNFGSGLSFQDLVILTKTLVKKPGATIDIHLIDLKFTNLASCRDDLKDTRVIRAHKDTVPTTSSLDAFADHVVSKDLVKERDKEKIKKALLFDCASVERPMQEFIGWLSQTFPQARLSLHVHGNTNKYLQYLEDHKLEYPDVISAVDIDDEISQIQGSLEGYRKLCSTVLSKKPDARNICLFKFPDQVVLARVSLEKTEGAEEIPAQDGETGPFYLTLETIKCPSCNRGSSPREDAIYT